MIIKVLGPGCMNCITLEKRTKEAISLLKVDALVEKITDYSEILSYGIVRTPGLLIDGMVAVQGRVPTVDELQEILKKHIN